MKRSILVLLLAVILLGACTSASQVTRKEYRLYELTLRGFKKFGYENFVVQAGTSPTSDGLQADALWKSLSTDLPDLQQATVESFIRANAKSAALQADFDEDYKVQLFDPAGLKALVGDPILWDKFSARFPACPGVLTFSRAGFNPAGNQALLYYTITTANDVTSSFFYLMTRTEGKWQISASTQVYLQ